MTDSLKIDQSAGLLIRIALIVGILKGLLADRFLQWESGNCARAGTDENRLKNKTVHSR